MTTVPIPSALATITATAPPSNPTPLAGDANAKTKRLSATALPPAHPINEKTATELPTQTPKLRIRRPPELPMESRLPLQSSTKSSTISYTQHQAGTENQIQPHATIQITHSFKSPSAHPRSTLQSYEHPPRASSFRVNSVSSFLPSS